MRSQLAGANGARARARDRRRRGCGVAHGAAGLRGHASFAQGAGAVAVAVDAAALLLPIHVRTADFEMRLFCTYMTLGTPRDVTLQELRVETFFPADAESERVWRAVTAS